LQGPEQLVGTWLDLANTSCLPHKPLTGKYPVLFFTNQNLSAMGNHPLSKYMRTFHRYLGFFLAGVMAMYAVSGIVLIFRKTDFLKKEKVVERTLPKDIPADAIGRELGIRDFRVDRTEGDRIHFAQGTFDRSTGTARLQVKELPTLLEKMTKLHKATTESPLYFLNIFFGASLFFFVLSSFWMFTPSSRIFRKGMYFTIGGIVLVLLMLLV
jgi:hypothetical protein